MDIDSGLGLPGRDDPAAAVIPAGAGRGEERRLCDLYDSIMTYAPWLHPVIVVDDARRTRDFASLLGRHSRAQHIVTIANPRRGAGFGRLGGLAAGILAGMRWVRENTACVCALKLDSDALAIGDLTPLLKLVRSAGVGVAGSVGRSAPGSGDMVRWETSQVSPIVAAAESLKSGSPMAREAAMAVRHLLPDIERARENGYRALHYCQGGAYIVTREMLERMAAQGCFERTQHWVRLPIGEDVIMAMYAYATGLAVVDASRPGEPFSCSWRGLPKPPARLLASGHCLTHSLKDDAEFSEPGLRRFFRKVRRSYSTMHPESWTFYCHAPARTALQSSDPKVVILGALGGDISLGRAASFHSLISGYKLRRPELHPVTAVSAEHWTGSAAQAGDPPLVVFSPRPLPAPLLAEMGLVPMESITNVTTLHVSGGFPEQSGGLANSAELLAAIREFVAPAQSVYSGQQLEAAEADACAIHLAAAETAIGCADPETVGILRARGVAAEWTGHDSLNYFLGIAASLAQAREAVEDHRQGFSFDTALDSSMFSEDGGPEQLRDAVALLNHSFRQVQASRPGSIPVVVNSHRGDRFLNDSWSTLRLTHFVRWFPEFLSIDLVTQSPHRPLIEATERILRAGAGGLISTSLPTALLLTCCNVPSYILCFGSKGRMAASALLQQDDAKTYFERSTASREAHHAQVMNGLRQAAARWLATL